MLFAVFKTQVNFWMNCLPNKYGLDVSFYFRNPSQEIENIRQEEWKVRLNDNSSYNNGNFIFHPKLKTINTRVPSTEKRQIVRTSRFDYWFPNIATIDMSIFMIISFLKGFIVWTDNKIFH